MPSPATYMPPEPKVAPGPKTEPKRPSDSKIAPGPKMAPSTQFEPEPMTAPTPKKSPETLQAKGTVPCFLLSLFSLSMSNTYMCVIICECLTYAVNGV